MHWRRKWQPIPVFLPGESQGWGSLVGCRLWGRRVGHDRSDLAAAAAKYASGLKGTSMLSLESPNGLISYSLLKIYIFQPCQFKPNSKKRSANTFHSKVFLSRNRSLSKKSPLVPHQGKHFKVSSCLLVTQSYPTLCNPMDRNPPGSYVHEILQARI